MPRLFLLLFVLMVCCADMSVLAQPTCFTVNNPSIGCTASCATFTVVPCVPGLSATNTYSVSSIPYAPYSYSGGTPILVNQDDVWSASLPLPFRFCFFGASHNSVIIGANGQLGFNTTLAGGGNGWSITGGLPGGALPNDVRNCILTPYQDINPATLGSVINFQTLGTAPGRIFVVSWNNISMFSCTGMKATQQVVLYEATNTIDINIANKPVCAGWNGGLAITGICGSGGAYYTAPGENGTVFTATNESWRFSPTGTLTPWTYTWTAPGGAVAGTGDILTVCPTGTAVYTVTASSTSCTGLAAVLTATVTSAGSAGVISGAASICAGNSTQFSNTATGGTWSTSNAGVATVDGSGLVTGVSAGSAVISYGVSAGCFTTQTITVYAAAQPIVGAVSVCVGSSIQLSNAVAGGTWTSSNNPVATVGSTGMVGGVSPGVAVISYTSVCGVSVHTVTVSPLLPPISGGNTVCAGSTLQLSNAGSGGVWSSANTPVATVDAVGVVTGITAGIAVISYANSCSVPTRTVTVLASPSQISGGTGMCLGATLQLSNTAAGGTWTSGATSVATVGVVNGLVAGVSAGTAVITYSNQCGFMTTTVSISVLAPIVGASALCVGAVVSMSNATPGGTWSSSNGPVAAVFSGTGVVTGMSAGTAVISYTANGCTQTKTITVSVPPTAIVGPMSVCVGSSVTLSSSPGGGTWFSDNVVVATISSAGVVTGVTSGVATVSYSLGGACLVSRSITVTPLSVLSAGAADVCTGNIVTLSNATGGGTWGSGNIGIVTVTPGGNVTGVATGTAVVSYALSSCSIYITTVTVNPGPAGIMGDNHICIGSSTVFTNATAGGTWSISNSAVASVSSIASGSITLLGLAAGTCGVTYTMPGGCYTTLTLVVHQPPGAILGKDTVCAGASIRLSNAVTGGIWASSATTVANVTAGVVTGVSAGQAVISYSTVPVINGTCMVTKMVTVVPAPSVSPITGPAVVCMGDSIMLTNATVDGVWTSSNSTIATVSDAGTVVAVTTGGVIISYTINTTCGAVSATKSITVSNLPVAGNISGPDSVCVGSTIALSDDEPGGVWSCSAGVATVSNTGVVAGLSAGTVEVSYTVTNICGSAVATATITVNALPDAGIISGPDSLCKGADVVLSESVGGGVWSSSNVSVATVEGATGNMHVLAEGVAIISHTVTSSAGCIAVATHTVLVTPSLFGLGVVMTPVSCYGATDGGIATYITGTKPTYEYLWSTGAITPGVSGLGAGSYALHVESLQTRCAIDTSFILTQPDSIKVEDSSLYDLCNRGTGKIMLTVIGGTGTYSYLWSTNATTRDLEQLHAGVYSVTVTDINNCTEQHSATVADSACSAIVVHNVITPNGDGYNDAWVIEGIQGYPGCMVQVFDKWGDKVFEKQGYQNDWSGQGRNGLLPDGTYYYLIKLNGVNVMGGADAFAGYVMIKR